jgi:hypothetical protein
LHSFCFDVDQRCRAGQLQNSPASVAVRVTDLEEGSGSATITNSCQCHSYEKISRNRRYTLYLEHIDEIKTYCQDIMDGSIMDGSEDICPYLCFHSCVCTMSSARRAQPIPPTAVNATGLCRMAAHAPDGTDLPLVNLVRPDSTPTDGTAEQTPSAGNHISWSQAICPGWLIIVLPSTKVVGRKYFHECMYKAPVKNRIIESVISKKQCSST